MTVITNVSTPANRVISVKSIYCFSMLSHVTEYHDLGRWKPIFKVTTCRLWWRQLHMINGFIFLGDRLLLATALNKYSGPAGPNIKQMDCSPLTLTSSDPIHGSTLTAHISINDTKEEIWRGFILSYFTFSSSWLLLMLPSHESWRTRRFVENFTTYSHQIPLALFFSVQSSAFSLPD